MPDPFKDLEKNLTAMALTAVSAAQIREPDVDAGEGAALVPNKGGAPIGNQNARTHGLYSRRLTPEQQEVYENARRAYALVEEVALLRVRLHELQADPDSDPKLILQTMTVLARMARADDRIRFGP